jgi:hypothetical protein
MRSQNTTVRRAALPVALVIAGAIALGIYDALPGRSGDGAPSDGTPTNDSRSTGSTDAPPTAGPQSATPSASGAPSIDYLLMPSSELMSLPTTGPAWDSLIETARSRWPRPDFNDQDNQTDTLALAAALAYARTGDAEMRARARGAIMAVIPTFKQSELGEGLGPLRQTAGWVLAADFTQLDGDDEVAFRAFLERVLTERTGRHSRWHHVAAAHDDSSNNWGAWAGAARIAARLYLDQDVGDATDTFRGFLGDRGAWAKFLGQTRPVAPIAAEWACDPSTARFRPVNGPCSREGIDLDGAIPNDISRGSQGLQWPPRLNGIMYTHETIAGYMLQAELLYRSGYLDIWETEDEALRRMADVITRSEEAGGPGWNPGRVQYHIPWLLNLRYGTDYPTVPAAFGRAFGFTDWLYGS